MASVGFIGGFAGTVPFVRLDPGTGADSASCREIETEAEVETQER